MLGFDSNLPLENMAGQSVWSVCFTQQGVSFRLDNDDEIVVYCLGELLEDNADVGLDLNGLIALAGSKLTGISILSGAHAVLTFENNVNLNLYDRLNEFEKYAFIVDRTEYVV